MLKVADHAFRTDTGRQRNANEDSYYVHGPRVRRRRRDGRRPGRRGRVQNRRRLVRVRGALGDESGESYLRSIAEAANERIHSLAQDDKSHSGMGTTLTAAAGGGRRGLVRARRRQSRLRLSRRRAPAAHLRPLSGRGAAAPGQAHRRAGRGSSAAVDHHQGAGPRGRGRGRHAHLQRPPRRRVPDLLGRPDDDDPGRAHRRGAGVVVGTSTRRRPAWWPRPTRPVVATTSRWSPSGSRRPTTPKWRTTRP